MSRSVDVVVIGSGHNGLVAAAYLAMAGLEVEVLERNPECGGAVATEELTLPGFRHDTFSGFHPLFTSSASYAELGDELAARGLRYLNTETPAATAFGDGDAVLAYRDPARTAAEFRATDREPYLAELDEFGRRSEVVLRLSAAELWQRRSAAVALSAARKLGTRGSVELLREITVTARGWLSSWAQGPEPGLLWAPWTLHTGQSIDDAGSGFQLRALAGGIHAAGMPVPEGGGARLVQALRLLIEDHGGRVRTGTDVTRVVVRAGRAIAVRTDAEEVAARFAVIGNVTPTQLYGRLLDSQAFPEARRQARQYRYGRACLQIHLALDEPPRWRDERLREVAVVHISDGLDAVGLSSAQATAGLLPAKPTIVCGQPVVLDASRAPAGKSILWLQLLDVPTHPAGDAAGELDVTDGTWTTALTDGFADRVLAAIAKHAPNVPDAVLGRAVLSPTELARRNINLVGGHPYAGSCQLDQSYLWRPLPGYGSHATPVEGLYVCGAATHPGPGLNAASGRLVAQQVLRKFRRRSRWAHRLRMQRSQ